MDKATLLARTKLASNIPTDTNTDQHLLPTYCDKRAKNMLNIRHYFKFSLDAHGKLKVLSKILSFRDNVSPTDRPPDLTMSEPLFEAPPDYT